MSFPADINNASDSPGRVDIISWAIRVAAWDGLLPIFVLSVPVLTDSLLPNRPDLSDLVGAGLPIIAFVIRLFVGTRHIWSNGCCHLVRVLQSLLLWVVVFLFVLVDTMLIIAHQFPGAGMKPADLRDMEIVLSIYLPCMVVAMYPGRTKSNSGLRPE